VNRMQKRHLLVVIPESPFPPRKNGLSLRYYPLLDRLSRVFAIDLVVVTPNTDRPIALGDLGQKLHRVIPIHRPRPRPSFLTKVAAQLPRLLPFGMPFGYVDYGASYVAQQLKPVLSESHDTVLWVTQDHVFWKCLPYLKGRRLILDQVDSNTLHLRRLFSTPSLSRRVSIAKMQRWEARMMDSADVGFYISPVDLQAVERSVKHVALAVAPNGILIDDYCSEKAQVGSPSLGFLGNMSYLPNVDAAHRLHRIYQSLRDVLPGLKLYIIGRDPDPSLSEYSADPNVVITGTVENIWPYVNAVDLFVLPLRWGAGQQNKLLEVMYAGRPVVATAVANGGVGAVDGESILLGNDDETLRQKALALLRDSALREKIGTAGGRFVRQVYGWDQIAARFAQAIDPGLENLQILRAS
jgi:glycosyltransferase involved in cell wall biosynthesis